MKPECQDKEKGAGGKEVIWQRVPALSAGPIEMSRGGGLCWEEMVVVPTRCFEHDCERFVGNDFGCHLMT